MRGNTSFDRNFSGNGFAPWLRSMWLAVACCTMPALAAADDASAGSIPLSEIALELSNPITALRTFGIDIEHTQYQGDLPGADEQDGVKVDFSLAWPVRLKNGNLMLRLTIPTAGDQPYWNPVEYLDYADFIIRQVPDERLAVGQFGTGHDHLGAVSFDIGYSQTSDDGVFSMFGLSSVAPTSDDMSARRGQWLLGPEFALGKMADWGLYGFRARHVTNVAGSGEQELGTITTNETTLHLFYAYSLGKGWQIESNPEILYDWEGVSGNQWLVPVGGGVSKTFRIGRVPIKVGLEGYYFAVSPDRFGPEWQAFLNFTPVLSTRLLR